MRSSWLEKEFQKQELSQEEEKLLKDHTLDMAHVYAIDQRRNAADLENILADKGIDFAACNNIKKLAEKHTACCWEAESQKTETDNKNSFKL